jgi:hypothetical protein
MGIAGQEPSGIGLFAVYRDSMTCEPSCLPACAPGNGQRVPAPRVRDVADNDDFFQLAVATDLNLSGRGWEVGGEPIPTEWRFTRIEEHDIVRHQTEQAGQIAGIDGTDPGRMNLAEFLFIRSHLLRPPPVVSRARVLGAAGPRA